MKGMKRAKLCAIISASVMVIALLLSLLGMGVNLGIDFAGGLSMQYDMGAPIVESDLTEALNAQGIKTFTITMQGANANEVNIRIKDVDQDGVQSIREGFESALKDKYPQMMLVGDLNYVGPVAGATLLNNAFLSVVIASVLMLLYIAWRFDLNSGIAAVSGLIHDVLIMWSFMVIFRSVIQMNSSFIAAMLTIVGYSINNTIVIFDRIRENAKKLSPTTPRADVVSISVRESLGRTINTTLTTLITISLLFILGVASIREFALPIIVGILSGVYSANMINGYIWALLEEKKMNRKPHARKKSR